MPVTSSVLAPPISTTRRDRHRQWCEQRPDKSDALPLPADHLYRTTEDFLRFGNKITALTARRNVAVATTRICGGGILADVQQTGADIANRAPLLH